ncbi:MAG TPA: M23/M56 family metallopeptidase, partial [Hyphomonas sp.]|nr:M23/M56 family metallopeptidase [Hyphomonas sp.]
MSPAGLVLLALVWSALVWAGARLICRLKPSPQMAQTVWRAAALALAAPFAASLIVPGLPLAENAPLPDLPVFEPLMVVPQEGVTVAAQAPGVHLPDLGVLVIGIVAAGWLVRFGLWLVSEVRLQRLKARAMRTHRPIGHWAEAVGLSRTPQVHVIPNGAPFLAGIFKRSVYVPSALIGGEGAPQVIVHELVHLRRGDLVARPLERLVADLFWFSPFAWWIRNELDFWREAVVDQETVALTGDRIAYARTLASAARVSRIGAVLPVAAFTLRKKGTLKMRLNEILAEAPRRPRRTGLVLAAALVCAAPLALAQGMLIKGAAAVPGSDIVYSHALLDKATLTSAFGMRKHPITGETALHGGVDLAASEGTPIYAPADGVVTIAEMTEGYGNLVELVAGGETRLRFGQLASMDVKPGDVVKPG